MANIVTPYYPLPCFFLQGIHYTHDDNITHGILVFYIPVHHDRDNCVYCITSVEQHQAAT